MHDYYYGAEANQFSFYRIPKELFINNEYKHLSTDAKVLYGLLLNRMDLSVRNGWLDDKGRVFIIYTTEEIMEVLNCADNKATKLMNELEDKYGLIERKRQGQGKPNLIYVKNFLAIENNNSNGQPTSRFKNRENHESGDVKTTSLEPLESRTSNNDTNNTDYSDTDRIYQGSGCDPMAKRTEYREYFEKALELDLYRRNHPYHISEINEIEELMIDICCSTAKTIRISGDDKPRELVKSRFMKMDSTHLEYVLDCLDKNTTEIRNIRQYLLATLYNSTMTIDNFYTNMVHHDMANGLI